MIIICFSSLIPKYKSQPSYILKNGSQSSIVNRKMLPNKTLKCDLKESVLQKYDLKLFYSHLR